MSKDPSSLSGDGSFSKIREMFFFPLLKQFREE